MMNNRKRNDFIKEMLSVQRFEFDFQNSNRKMA